ncbi:anti-sigma factor [Halobacillus locisalis]|uniref:Anti-sigma factor n=1 Tax=Halobacillus locisalis TaxID=220753 RepID=A0A838CWD8_9BACI|nr:anti-sigma factor [Halobacillus locisalis]MBA2176233.1 anti-sigma factor [Halobacillus locisalis]
MSEEWKQRLKDYYEGNLSDKEAAEVEKELEKLDTYQEVIADELKPPEDTTDELEPDKAGKIIKNSIRNARFSLAAYVTMIILLILPVMMMVSYLYYGWGQKAEDLIQVAIQTVYVTEPNVSLEEMEIERTFGLFTFDVHMDLYKRVGKSDISLGDWDVSYNFDQAEFPNRHYIIENPPQDIPLPDQKKLFHPEAEVTNRDLNAWDKLEKLPEGTVSELYVSLEGTYSPTEMRGVLEDVSAEWIWYAIDTGLEAEGKSSEGGFLPPIGYPAKPDPDGWSPYHSREMNEEQFMDSLRFLSKYENQATNIAHAKWLDLEERINHLETNGLKAYGGVVTGPTKELLKLENHEAVRLIHIGEVRLWNW